jgi:hypothetical protein
MARRLGAPRPGRADGIWRGEVTRVDGLLAFVMVPRLSGRREYGPVEVAEHPGTPGLSTGVADLHSHPLSTAPLAKGDAVFVGFIEGDTDQVVVLGRRPK